MSTETARRPKEKQTAELPEWRRLCHIYNGDSPRSLCGVGIRKAGEDHFKEECNARGHTICVVCTEIVANW
jgi:hypothetical protein